ncbi:MAG: TonB-dependent receptor plug domain-containing protein, partial [Bacteroidota bacterium]
MRCRLSLLFFLLFPCLVAAQNATLRGRIRNAQGEAQPGVIIRQKDNPAAGTSTDIEGRFSLLLPAGQNITILFKGTGARESASEFFLRPGEIREVEITYDATVEVSMVEVVDVRSREGGIKPITVKLPTRLPTIQQGIEAYLIQAPVNFPSELSSSYSVRGGSFDENLVYVNDIQVYRPFLVRAGEQEGLSFPNPDMVRSIDFSAGGFQARFGDKMSSVL